MGLEAPLALLGLLAALLPVLAHRMRQRELPRVVLPTFALLLRAQAVNRRKRSFTDTLLLALRIALISAACLAVAAPYVTASLPFGDGRIAATAIVIDDSLSMMRTQAGRTLLGRAIERARSAVDALPQGSELCIVLGGKPARVLVPLGHDLLTAAHELELLPSSSLRGADLDGAANLAARALSATHLPARRLLILSDFARHTGLDPASLDLDGVEVTSERLGAAPTLGNAFIDSVHAAADPTQPGRTSIAVELSQNGPALGAGSVELVQAGSVVASSALTFRNGHAKALLQLPTPDDKGEPGALLRLRIDDALEADNQAGVLLTRADAVRVLLVDGDPHPASDSDELYYAQRALRLLPAQSVAVRSRTIDPLLLPRQKLDDVDVVVLANVPAPSAAVAQQLLHFVERGGGLLITAGDHVDPATYNTTLGAVLPAHLSSWSPTGDLRLREPRDHSLLPAGLAGLGQARTHKRMLVDAGASTLLEFQDGTPAIAAHEIGSGRCLLLTTTLDADASDLPLRPGYLALWATLLHYAAGPAATSLAPSEPGAPIELPVAAHAVALDVIDPSGHAEHFQPSSAQRVQRYTRATAIGAYELRTTLRDAAAERSVRGAFLVTAPKEESDLSAGVVPANSQARAAAGGSTTHRPLGSWIFLLAGLLVLGEGVMRLGKRR